MPIGLRPPIPSPVSPLRSRRAAPGIDADAWSAALAALDPATLTTLKEDASTAVLAGTLLGEPVVLKAWRLTAPVARLRAHLGLSRAHRQWHGAALLVRHALPTAAPIALLFDTRDAPPAEWLILPRLTGPTLLDLLAVIHADPRAVPARAQHALARALGEQLHRFSAVGLFNRDHKPSNLIITTPPAGEPHVIDTVAIRPVRSGDWRPLRRMLTSLMLEPLGCRVPPRRALRLRVLATLIAAQSPALPRDLRRQALRGAWQSITRLIEAHGDPTPKVDPLNRAPA